MGYLHDDREQLKRFSEDIDITIDMLLSQGQKKRFKQVIVETAEELGLTGF